MHFAIRALSLFFIMGILAACPSPLGNQNMTREQLPHLSDYREYEGEEMTDQLSSNEILNTLLMAQPQLAVVAEVIAQAGSCAQQQGIVNWRAYVHKQDAAAAGVVVIASNKQYNTPQNLLQCAVLTARQRALPIDFSPCSRNFSYAANNDTYYVFYAASQQRVCEAFEAALPDGQ